MKKNVTNVYLFGGCGLSLGAACDVEQVGDFSGFGQPNMIYFDSSKANIPGGDTNVTLRSGTDGFGKDREEAKRLMGDQIDPFLRENPPTEFNILVFSLSGGTGSVLGPLVVEAINRLGKNVVSIVVQAAECEKSTSNTLETIRDLNKVSNRLKKPVVVSFHDNFGPDCTMESVNKAIHQELRTLMILCSQQNVGLDSSDMEKLLDYTTVVPNVKHRLVDLLINFGNELEVTGAVSTISLLVDPMSPPLNIIKHWGKNAYIPSSTVGATKVPMTDMHFITTPVLMAARMIELEKYLSHFPAHLKAMEDAAYDFGDDEE
jgi:hypothetical protein